MTTNSSAYKKSSLVNIVHTLHIHQMDTPDGNYINRTISEKKIKIKKRDIRPLFLLTLNAIHTRVAQNFENYCGSPSI